MRALLLLAAVTLAGQNAIAPASATLLAGQTQRFTADCGGKPCTLDWGIDTEYCGFQGARAGAIDANGVYTAPATVDTQQTVYIGVSVNGEFRCGAAITLLKPAPPPPLPKISFVGQVTVIRNTAVQKLGPCDIKGNDFNLQLARDGTSLTIIPCAPWSSSDAIAVYAIPYPFGVIVQGLTR